MNQLTCPKCLASTLAIVLLLSGCGPDTLTAASGSAGSAATAAQQAKEQQARAQARIRQMQQSAQDSADAVSQQADRESR
ncbi:MAG TPA: hypothetical protein VEE84_06800 [Burkholderiaceae bacterium]|nr:hypothetical protein [Burkholderiaceae bacterium]